MTATNPQALDEAVRRATADQQLSPEAAAELKNKAVQLLSNPEERKRIEQMKLAAVYAGLPVVRATLGQLIELGNAEDKKQLRDALESLTRADGKDGALTVGVKGGVQAHIHLGECAKNHDLDGELNKVKAVVTNTVWAQVQQAISQHVSMAVMYYHSFVREHTDLIAKIRAGLPDTVDPLQLKIDKSNTTIYVADSQPRRVGLFVSLG
ncbi:MAG: hypothetical protein KGL39_01575 [Patescibacteria group bacterium]|nr:hypothetical protein [Patescibacteria group bacterium]